MLIDKLEEVARESRLFFFYRADLRPARIRTITGQPPSDPYGTQLCNSNNSHNSATLITLGLTYVQPLRFLTLLILITPHSRVSLRLTPTSPNS